MNRSQFVRNSVLATGAIVGGGLSSAIADAKKSSSQTGTFNLNYGPHQGMFENHAGKNILDQIQFMYDQGFSTIVIPWGSSISTPRRSASITLAV